MCPIHKKPEVSTKLQYSQPVVIKYQCGCEVIFKLK